MGALIPQEIRSLLLGRISFSSRVVVGRASHLVADEALVIADMFHLLDWG